VNVYTVLSILEAHYRRAF